MLRARHAIVLTTVVAASACGRIGITLQPYPPDDPSRTPDAGVMDGGVYNRDAGAAGATGGTAGSSGASGRAGASGSAGSAGRAGTGGSAGSGGNAGSSGTNAGKGGQSASDASVPDASTAPDAATPSCAGKRVFDICWYLGPESQNCQDLCAAHGGFDTQSITHVGTAAQGGSRDDCQQILDALGRPATAVEAQRTDGYGFGCHVWQNSGNYWLTNPPFDPDVQAPNAPVRMACGCER